MRGGNLKGDCSEENEFVTLKEIVFRAEINAGLLKLSRPLLSAYIY